MELARLRQLEGALACALRRYTYVEEIVWVKMTTNRRLAKSHGYYLQHAKEVCLVGKKGDDPEGMRSNILSDVIMRCAARFENRA